MAIEIALPLPSSSGGDRGCRCGCRGGSAVLWPHRGACKPFLNETQRERKEAFH